MDWQSKRVCRPNHFLEIARACRAVACKALSRVARVIGTQIDGAMSTRSQGTGKQGNLIRFDLSDYLIHFVRHMKADADDALDLPEDWGWDNIAEDVAYSPFFLLRCILRHGRIWATWSVRGIRDSFPQL